MVDRLVNRLVIEFLSDSSQDVENKEWYEYALLHVIESFLSIVGVIVIGIISGRFLPVLFFVLFFVSLRERTGGYHCRKFWQCYVASGVSVIAAEIIEKMMRDNPVILYVILSIAALIVAIVGTVNHPDMHMNLCELTKTKKKARITLSIEITAIILSELLGMGRIIVDYMILAIVLCSILVLTAKIKNQEVIVI